MIWYLKNESPYSVSNSILEYKRISIAQISKKKKVIKEYMILLLALNDLTNENNEILGHNGNVKYKDSLLGYKPRQSRLKMEI